MPELWDFYKPTGRGCAPLDNRLFIKYSRLNDLCRELAYETQFNMLSHEEINELAAEMWRSTKPKEEK